LVDYADGYKVFVDEPEKVNVRINGIKEDNKNLIKELIEKSKQVPELLQNLTEYKFEEKNVINLKEADEKNNHFRLREVNLFKGDIKSFEEDIKEAARRDKKIICKKNITILFVTLLIPFILGYIYHLAPSLYNILHLDAWEALQDSLKYSSGILNHSFNLYGYIYVNFYSNMLLLLIPTIYYIYQKVREKELFSFDIILLAFLVGFIVLLELGLVFGKVSTYYIMKNYYALWIIVFYMNFRAMIYIYEKDKLKPWVMVLFYMLLIISNLIFIDAPLGKGPKNENENIANVTEIFGVNKTIIKTGEIDLKKGEIDILKYAKENLDFNKDKIEIMGDSEQIFWAYGMIRKINYDDFLDDPQYGGQDRLTLKAMTAYKKIGKVDYMIYFNQSYYYNQVKDLIFENGEVIYENDAGGIIKYEI